LRGGAPRLSRFFFLIIFSNFLFAGAPGVKSISFFAERRGEATRQWF
jgi:hypothetical protein